ncbi:hypothetical protein [Streptomyces netropsis]|uniref:Uncharacterized protein n=1 Tax=Streptomyces netropsis TaxID=55404 RepID=A0A7W7LBK9_STRNE|nr:hypothetical protein [Streptomyces netropsis]MBB4887228.1 hypothetical protein [Streptomyces netropsis]GGR08785.1 hypothetical protein GCM10010219_11540 [Streptomyces netropsis]
MTRTPVRTDDEAVVERAIELLRAADLGLTGLGENGRRLAALLRSVAGGPSPAEPPGTVAAPGATGITDVTNVTDVTDELPCVVREWARAMGVTEAAFRADRRAFLRGDLAGVELCPRALVRAAVPRLRGLSALPEGHRLSLVWTRDRPSVTFPVRIPDRSAVALPDRPAPLCAQYVHHELGHAMELAWRSPGLPLAERWRRPPVLAEWGALVVETLGLSAAWLASLGVPADTAERVAAHCRYEDRYTRALAALILRCAARPERLEEEVARTSGDLIDPRHVREETERAGYWSAVFEGHALADRTVAGFTERWGERWWDEPGSWRELREQLTAGPAGLSSNGPVR